jgi:hypothetical protein
VSRLKEIGGLNYDQYVDLVGMMMSEDPAAVAEVNRLLFVLLLKDEEIGRNPALALSEIVERCGNW